MVRPTVVLPQPDSPTSPSVSPAAIVNETSSTAFTIAFFDDSKPTPAPLISKYLCKPLTSSSGVSAALAAAAVPGFGSGGAGTSVPAAISRARQQAEWWPPPTSSSAGSWLQTSIRNGQRGANRQPLGGERRSGGRPSMVSRRCPRGISSRGTERIRPIV
jgi:hypothetical protein